MGFKYHAPEDPAVGRTRVRDASAATLKWHSFFFAVARVMKLQSVLCGVAVLTALSAGLCVIQMLLESASGMEQGFHFSIQVRCSARHLPIIIIVPHDTTLQR